MDLLIQLETMSTVVADTGDIVAIKRLKPTEATTNPSLVAQNFSATSKTHDLKQAAQSHSSLQAAIRELTVSLGADILQIIPGRVSTEVDPELSYDTEATYSEALKIIEAYDKLGVNSKRVLIKIAATWDGIQAARKLEQQGIGCNLTLIFSDAQALACADAGATLISPFVGRLLDWQKADLKRDHIATEDDLGVRSVKSIYHQFKSQGITTQVMGASFRSIEQVIALAGCDLLTIAPSLIDELAQTNARLKRALKPDDVIGDRSTALQKHQFDSQLKDNKAASELLDKGIKGFIKAQNTLKQMLQKSTK